MAQATAEQPKPIRWPRDGAPEFTLEYKSAGGPYYAPDLTERFWSLSIDSRRAECILDRARSDAETPGEPIGLFKFDLTDEELIAVQNLINTANFASLKPAPKGNPGSSLQSIDYWAPPGRQALQFDSTDRALSGKIWPFMEKIFELLSKGLQHPSAAIALEVIAKPGQGSPLLTLRLVNVGIAPVAIHDPRVGLPGPQRITVLRVAPKPAQQKGVTPVQPRWAEIPIPRDPKNKGPAVVVLDPGAALELGPIPWVGAPKGVPCLVHGFWSDYDRAIDPKGTYQARGAATSNWIEVTP